MCIHILVGLPFSKHYQYTYTHMARVNIYIQKSNERTWGKIPKKSDFINKVLVQLGAEMRAADRAKKKLEKQNNGDQDEATTKPQTETTQEKVS